MLSVDTWHYDNYITYYRITVPLLQSQPLPHYASKSNMIHKNIVKLGFDREWTHTNYYTRKKYQVQVHRARIQTTVYPFREKKHL